MRDDELPKRGRDIELERRIAPSFVSSDTYGTRASTVVIVERAGEGTVIHFAERRFAAMGVEAGRRYVRMRNSATV